MPAAAQTTVATYDKATIGGDTLPADVLRLVGLGTVASGSGTINPLTRDNLGDVRRDSNTTVSTAGAWTWGGAGSFTSTLGVTGVLSGNTGTLLLGDSRVTNTTPSFWLHDSDAASNEKYTALEADAGLLSLKLYDDTPSSANTLFQVDRTGLVPDDWRWGSLLATIRPENNGSSTLGSLTKMYSAAYIWDLVAQTLTAKEVVSTIGGEVLVAPTTSLTRDVASGGSFIYVKHNLMRTNDTVVLKVNGSGEKMLVTGSAIDCSVASACLTVSNDWAYPVTRNRQGSGAKDWLAGAAVVNEGNVGDGIMSLFADRSSSVSDGYPGVVISDGPVAYWRMETATATTSVDVMGNVGVATETGTQSTGLGTTGLPNLGNAGADPVWSNTSAGGYLAVANDSDLQITGDLTVEAIVYWGGTGPQNIISRGGAKEFSINVNSNGSLTACHGNTSTFECDNSATGFLVASTWTHIAIVRDSTSSPKQWLFYKNGVLNSTATFTQAVTTSTNQLRIGDNPDASGNHFGSYIDEVAIYNYRVAADRLLLHSSARTNDSISRFTLGPTACGLVRTGTGAFDMSERWCVGNLAGTYGYTSATATYGLAAGDASTTWISADATNGFRIMNGSTEKLKADTSGNLSMTGDLTIGTNGVFRSAAATALGTGTGLYMAGGSTPTFRVGVPSGNEIKWDGTDLTVKSNNFAVNTTGVFVNHRTSSTFNAGGGYNWTSSYAGQVPSIWVFEDGGALYRQMSIDNISTSSSRATQTQIMVSAQGATSASINLNSGLSGTAGIVTTTATNAAFVLSGNFTIDGNVGLTTTVVVPCGTLSFHKGILYSKGTC